MKKLATAIGFTAASIQAMAGWSCTMPNGSIIFQQLSECAADAVHAEQRATALPNPGPRPKPPSANPVAASIIATQTPNPQPEQDQPRGLPLGQPRGYISNDWGDKCWFKQTTVQRIKYFQTAPNKTATLIFDDPRCMKKSELGQDANKMMINNFITNPYASGGAAFQTRASELYKTSLFQIRGQCIQSATFGLIGVAVEYHEANGSIYMVKHAPSVGRCSNTPVTKFE